MQFQAFPFFQNMSGIGTGTDESHPTISLLNPLPKLTLGFSILASQVSFLSTFHASLSDSVDFQNQIPPCHLCRIPEPCKTTFPEPHMSSSCPICHLTIPLLELEWHVNDHLVEEELARDMDLARQIASAPSPPRVIAVPVPLSRPLYFQHDGHSRTIVGMQIQKGPDGMPERHSLLILDPAHRTSALERSLRENSGWQKLIKRGAHTLKKPQYQLCFVDPGIAHGAEMDQLKTLDSIYFEF